jgi:hypothetical protein
VNTYGELWRYTSTILHLCTRWRWVVSLTPWPLFSRWKLCFFALVFWRFRGLTIAGVWIGEYIWWSDLLHTHHSWLDFTDYTDYCPQSIAVFTSRFLATDFNNYYNSLTITTAHIRSFFHSLPFRSHSQLTCNWESGSELLYDWRFTANQFILASSPLRLTARFFSQFSACGLM